MKAKNPISQPMFEPAHAGDVEAALKRYLAQFAHQGCGGAPEAIHGQIICTGCKQAWVWLGTVEYTLQQIKVFRSLVI